MREYIIETIIPSPLFWLGAVWLLGAVVISAVAFSHARDETPGGGSTVANVMWLFLGGGLPVACLFFILGIALWPIPFFRDASRRLRDAVRYVCAPAEFFLRRSRRYKPLGAHWVWLFLVGFWLACAEFVIGLAYCCLLVGIPFGRKHLVLARFLLFPCAHNVMTLAEYEDYLALRLHEGR
jgi:uncharacterized membrane protein YccF (DUF307 family)